MLCSQKENKLKSLESFLNLGADEVDIRTIKTNFTVVDLSEVDGVRPGPVSSTLQSTSPGRQ